MFNIEELKRDPVCRDLVVVAHSEEAALVLRDDLRNEIGRYRSAHELRGWLALQLFVLGGRGVSRRDKGEGWVLMNCEAGLRCSCSCWGRGG